MADHWYCAKTGEPRYTVIGKNGKERNTTIRDARDGSLYPSVTTINGMLSKAGLNTWLQTEAIKAAIEYPSDVGVGAQGDPQADVQARRTPSHHGPRGQASGVSGDQW